MTWGSYGRTLINGFLNNTNVRTILTHTQRSGTMLNTDGGYSGSSYTTGTAIDLPAIPTTYVRSKTNYATFGNLETGDVSFIVSGTRQVVKEDLVAYSSGTFRVITVNPILISGTFVAQEIVLKRDL